MFLKESILSKLTIVERSTCTPDPRNTHLSIYLLKLTAQRLFRNSSAVHFFSKTTGGLASHPSPRYSAYALLGPR